MCDIRWVVALLISSHLMGTGARSKIVTLAECRDYLSGRTPVRVGLAQGVRQVTLVCPGAAALHLDQKTIAWPAGRPLVIAPDVNGSRLRTNADEATAQVCQFEPASGASTEASADGAVQGRYFGALEIRASAGSLNLINSVPLETYLPGVVPAEMPSSFPREALKAQAIVARTYALYQLGAHESEGFDLCAGTHCQVYRGAAASARTSQAVTATSGQVLVVNAVLAKTVYHSTCGGTTSDAWKAWWGHLLPYLRGRSDGTAGMPGPADAAVERFLAAARGWCRGSSKYRWQVQMGWPEVQQKVAANLALVTDMDGRSPGRVLDLRVADRTSSGRVRRLLVMTDKGEESVWGDSVRWLFGMGKPGPGGLPSTLFTLTIHRDANGAPAQVIFQGGGWGHGIGMCQIGAAARATAGQNARQILRAYYTGARVVKAQ